MQLIFIIINGILTGTRIEQAIFDYNPQVISRIQLLLFPLKYSFYKFSLLLSPLVLTHIFEMSSKKIKNV
ncbi:MAG: hypothetical protein ACI849_001185 [Patiriisocius sp.]|jgi:hypothetical protein